VACASNEEKRTSNPAPSVIAQLATSTLPATMKPEKPTATFFQATVSAVPTSTFTKRPTKTLTPTPTETITPSITPTFDTSKINKATPGQPEKCPETNANANLPDFETLYANNEITEEHYLTYFNAGGSVFNIPLKWRPAYIVDLTNDGVPEYILQRLRLMVNFSILGCTQGEIKSLVEIGVSHNGE
jgi:hypothetical protein